MQRYSPLVSKFGHFGRAPVGMNPDLAPVRIDGAKHHGAHIR